jgi:hypothetical protein
MAPVCHIVVVRVICTSWAHIWGMTSGIIQEIRKNSNIKIPPKSPCVNFESPCKFKNPIFISKRFLFIFWPSQPSSPTGLFGLLAHSAHLTSSSSFSTKAGGAPPPLALHHLPASPRLHPATDALPRAAAPHPVLVSPSPSFHPQSKMPVKSKPFCPQ